MNEPVSAPAAEDGPSEMQDNPPACPKGLRRVNRLSVLLVCLTWPLIWIGSMVTTYDAGMAVPDWPNTYGYNMFLYPWTTWLSGPFDLFIEHGHRLLATLVGLIAIVMLIVAVRSGQRRWVRRLCMLMLVAVSSQGILGGARVLLDQRTAALLHGCLGAAVFVICWIVAGMTSRWWMQVPLNESVGRARKVLAALTAISYFQLILGAMLRHVPVDAVPAYFKHTVYMHLTFAVLVVLHALLAWRKLRRCGDLTLSNCARFMLGLVALQIGLGVSTWIVNYQLPWLNDNIPLIAGYAIEAKGWWQSCTVSAHVATGSLIVALAAWMWLRAARQSSGSRFAKPRFTDRLVRNG